VSDYELIREAIIERRQVIATYKGQRREMCPHAIGYTNGREQGLFFEFGGESSSGPPDGGQWCCLPIAELDSIEVVEGKWHSGGERGHEHSCVDVIDVEASG
jgi:hypothetical protein